MTDTNTNVATTVAATAGAGAITGARSGQQSPPAAPADGQQSAQQTQAPRLFAGKYESVEALEQAYTNAQSKIGELSSSKAPKTGKGDAAAASGFDAGQIEQMILTTGAVNPDARKALNEAGFSDRFIDSVTTMYKQGFETWKQTTQQSLTNSLDEVVQHINQKYAGNERMLDAYQAMLEAGETDFLKKYDQEIAAQKKEQPQFGSIPQAYGGEGYASMAEFGKDTLDPRYQSDANFRRMVQAKRARSNF